MGLNSMACTAKVDQQFLFSNKFFSFSIQFKTCLMIFGPWGAGQRGQDGKVWPVGKDLPHLSENQARLGHGRREKSI